jgi:L-threonylcarbamoyladenylate synthase
MNPLEPRSSGATTQRLDATTADPSAAILCAAELLRAGGTVAFPTETVYGLGANALDPAAVAKIFAAKARPNWDPLIVHIAGRAMLDRIAILPPSTRAIAEQLIASFWPGPLTLLLPRTSAVPDAVTAGRPLVGVRVPAHPIALELIRQADIPIAAPSANRFGHTSPTTAAHVLEDLDGRIDAVLDGGPCTVGLESTVLDPEAMLLYRPGAVTGEMIAAITGQEPRLYTTAFPSNKAVPEAEDIPQPSPGLELRHYAPRARLVLVDSEASLTRELAVHDPLHTGVMLPDGWKLSVAATIFPWGAWDNPEILARHLFTGLRTLDAYGVQIILCPIPPMAGLGDALRDRLTRAARR